MEGGGTKVGSAEFLEKMMNVMLWCRGLDRCEKSYIGTGWVGQRATFTLLCAVPYLGRHYS